MFASFGNYSARIFFFICAQISRAAALLVLKINFKNLELLGSITYVLWLSKPNSFFLRHCDFSSPKNNINSLHMKAGEKYENLSVARNSTPAPS